MASRTTTAPSAMQRWRILLAIGTLATTAYAQPQPKFSEPLDDVIVAKRAVLMEETTGKVLWSRDPETAAYPASTTKIMTGLLLLENTKPEDVIIAPKDIEKIKESSMHLKPFERVRAKNLIYAIMLRSANDGCYAAACHIAGSQEKFVEMMNKRAKEIGCLNTHFENTNGLNNPDHKISAHDLALIAREAMKREDFRRVVSTRKYKIDRSLNFKDLWMVSRNKILSKDKTADGIKTGWTIPSGHTYVGSVNRNGMRVFTSILDSKDWQGDHTTMANWAFKAFTRKLIHAPGPITKSEIGAGGQNLAGDLSIRENVYNVQRTADLRPVSTHFEPFPPGRAIPDAVGFWVVTDADGFEQRIPVYSSGVLQSMVDSVIKPKQDKTGIILGAIIITVAGTYWWRGQLKRSKKIKRKF